MSKESETIKFTEAEHLNAGRIYATKYTVVSLIQELQENGVLPELRPPRIVHLAHSGRKYHIHSYIDILLIDTEGFDPLVLKGASALFRNQDVRVFIFEYHGYCPWPLFKLNEIVNLFDKYQYDCFVVGKTHLWRLQNTCFHPVYDSHYWGNVMCVLRRDPWRLALNKYIITGDVAKAKLKNSNIAFTAPDSEKKGCALNFL